jgi:hypothetical protein
VNLKAATGTRDLSAVNFYSAFFILLTAMILCNDNSFADGPELKLSAKQSQRIAFSISDSLKKRKTGEFTMKKDPWKAVLYSAVLPGAGQYYNQSYWKIAVIAGLGAYFGYGIINNNNKYNDYKDLYQQSQTEANPDGDPQLQTFRDFYRDQRDDFIVYALILYVVNLVDAYVDAQLFDFDVSDLRDFPGGKLTFNVNF